MKQEFREISPAEFAEFTARCPAKSYMQSLPMYERYCNNGRECYLLGAFQDGKLVVAGLASVIYARFGRKIFTFSRGPLADYTKESSLNFFLTECKRFLKSRHGIVLQISPSLLALDAPSGFRDHLVAQGFKYLGEYEQVKWIYTIDFSKITDLPKVKRPAHRTEILSTSIPKSAEQILFRTFRSGHRYTIKYATSRYDLRLRVLPPTEYRVLSELMAASGKVHGFVPREQGFFEQMAEAFGDDVVAVVADRPDGTPTAVGFFILYGDEIIYLSSGMSREFKKLGGPHLIQWEMIKYAYANGYRKYNFWGTNPDPADGVFQFKQGFRGEVEEFVGTFAAALSPLGALYLKRLHPAEHRAL